MIHCGGTDAQAARFRRTRSCGMAHPQPENVSRPSPRTKAAPRPPLGCLGSLRPGQMSAAERKKPRAARRPRLAWRCHELFLLDREEVFAHIAKRSSGVERVVIVVERSLAIRRYKIGWNVVRQGALSGRDEALVGTRTPRHCVAGRMRERALAHLVIVNRLRSLAERAHQLLHPALRRKSSGAPELKQARLQLLRHDGETCKKRVSDSPMIAP